MPLFRMAQMVVKQLLEPQLELIFDQDSYSYKPAKSAHQAVESLLSSSTGRWSGDLNEHLSVWLRQNHSRLRRHDRRSRQVLMRMAQQGRDLFVHWHWRSVPWRGVGVTSGSVGASGGRSPGPPGGMDGVAQPGTQRTGAIPIGCLL